MYNAVLPGNLRFHKSKYMGKTIFSDRHKLFWAKPDIKTISQVLGHDDIPIINVGKLLAEFLRDRNIDKYISLDVEEYIKSAVREKAVDTPNGFKAIILHNPGILLEPELKLKSETILLDLSREIIIVILWDYLIEHNRKLRWDENNPIGFEFPENTIKKLELVL